MQKSAQILTDCQYNIAKQLEKKLEFLWHVDSYIKDAAKDGNHECLGVFKEIKSDEERHAKMLKGSLQIHISREDMQRH
jgi:rubrerythrin